MQKYRGVRAVSHWPISCARIDDLSEYSLWCVYEHLHACVSAASCYRVKVSAGRDGSFFYGYWQNYFINKLCVCVRFALRSIQHIVVHTVKCHRTTFRRQCSTNNAKQIKKNVMATIAGPQHRRKTAKISRPFCRSSLINEGTKWKKRC